MTAPKISLSTTGTDPKSTTKQILEDEVNDALQLIWDATVVSTLGPSDATALLNDLDGLRSGAADDAERAEAARDAAVTGAFRTWPTTAAALGNGVRGVTSIVSGSGGANGTFAVAFSGGTQVIAPVGVFTVAGGALVSVVITYPGYYSSGTPTLSFAASSGLTGASAVAQMAVNAPVNEYFVVPSPVLGEAGIIYQNVAGVATLIKRMPSSEFVEIVDDDFATYSFAVADAQDRVVFAIDFNGIIVVQDLGETSTGQFSDPDLEFSAVLDWAMTDSQDRVFAYLDQSGRVVFPGGIVGGGADGKAAPTVRRDRFYESFPADLNHFVMNGQSLSIRGGATLAVTDANDVAFSGGVILREEETGNTLVSLADTLPDSAVLWNAVQQLKFLIAGDAIYSADPDLGDYRVLMSSHGVSGAAIATLVKGGSNGAYEDLMFGVDEARRLSVAAGEVPAVQALGWMQGESNATGTTAAYLSAFQAMLADYRADIPVKTGQISPIPVFVYQLSSEQESYTPGPTLRPANVSQAFFEASNSDPNVLIATPMYWVPHSDKVHFNQSYAPQLGMHWGKAFYKRVVRGEKWRPLEPRRVTKISARVLVVAFNVPEGPLVFDTVTVTNPGDYGFKVEDDSGFVTVTEVQIVRDAVRITLAADLVTNPKVSYAHYGVSGNGGGPITGARGCLRDSDPTVGVNGYEQLWNWAVSFKVSVPYVKV